MIRYRAINKYFGDVRTKTNSDFLELFPNVVVPRFRTRVEHCRTGFKCRTLALLSRTPGCVSLSTL